MATFVLIHGAGNVGWYWHLVEEELRARGHDVVAPDLPCEDEAAGLTEYVDTVIEAIGDRRDLVVVGQSFGGFTAAPVAERTNADLLVLVAAMVPVPGETAEEYFAATGWKEAVQRQAQLDGGMTGNEDPYVVFYQDVPRDLAEEAMRRGRGQTSTPGTTPCPLEAWPATPTRFVLCTEDRFFPADFLRRVVDDRLGIAPDDIEAGHCVALSPPQGAD